VTKLKYHHAVFDLLKLAPLRSDERRRTLERVRLESPVPIPAAIVEWYSLENAHSLLRRPARGEEFLTFKSLIASIQSLVDQKRPRLELASEFQGRAAWAIDLTSNDDPPVLVRVLDDAGREAWRTMAEHYSDFLFTWIWDQFRSGYLAQAQAELSLKQIRQLSLGAQEIFMSKAWPTHKTFRFMLGNSRLRVNYRPDAWSEIILWSAELQPLAALAEHLASARVPREALFSDQPAVARLLSR
jgi:hypothetical protein